MKNWTLGVAAAAALVLARGPAAAQTAPNTTISGTISVMTWPTVNVQGIPTANSAYLNAVQRAMLSGGVDVAMVEISSMALLRDRDQWLDLSQAPYNAGDILKDFAPFTVANVTLPSGRINLLPKHTGPGGMFYRSDIFAKAGLPTDPAAVSALFSDWDKFISEGKKLVVPNERWVIGNGEEIVRAMMAEAGVSYFDKDGKLQLDNPVFKAGLERVKQAADAGMISPFEAWSPEWQGAFQRGQLATVMYGNWFGGLLKRAYAQDQSGQWSVTNAPALDGKRAFNSGGDYIGILKSSPNKEAAWAFIHWLVTDNESLKQQFQNDDLYPAYAPAGKADWMNFADPYYGGENVNTVFADVQASMVPFVLNPLDSVAATAMSTAINNVARNVMSVDDALAGAKAEIQAKM